MSPAHMLSWYRKSINPPYTKKDILVVIGTIAILFALPLTTLAILESREPSSRAAAVGITVDFTNVTRTLSPVTFGMDMSAYGWTGSASKIIANDPAHQQAIKTLKVPQMRINLGYEIPGNPNSRIVCYAEGCDHSVTVQAWINGIKAAGAEPMVEVQINAGEEAYWTTDATNMVRFMNITNNYNIKRWVVDNEPDNHGMSATTYSNGFNQVYDVMKAVDPTIKIGGPATAWYNRGFLDTFLQITAGRADFVDYHNYGQGGSNVRTDAQLLSETVKYENDPRDLRALINSRYGTTRGNQVEIELGEWNMGWTGDGRMLAHFNTIWSASAIHHMIKEGVIFRMYADKNHSLGAICQSPNEALGGTTYPCSVDGPMPIYHGIGMFTGESLFRHFGDKLVSVTSNLADVEASASDNPKNIVAINKNPTTTHQATFNLIGISSGTAEVWQKGPTDSAPVNKGTVNISGSSFSYNLGPYTVTTFLVNPTGTTDTTPPSVSVTSPLNAATVSGTVAIGVTAADNVGVTRVEFRIDGSLLSTDTTSPYSYSWNTAGVSNGSHTIQARAYDAAGNTTNSTVTVTVNNTTVPPPSSPGDINSDGLVNVFDLSVLLSNWNTSNQAADINSDGLVNIFDLSILLSNWT